jgi:hypothetical protein
MREFTKSLTSYGWAMSMFWTQQLFNVISLGSSPGNRSARAFNNVTEATANEMGEMARAVFRSGDALQRGIVDLLMAPFGFANGGSAGADHGQHQGQRGEWMPRSEPWSETPRGEARFDSDRYAPAGRASGGDGGRRGGWADTAARTAMAATELGRSAMETMTRQRPASESTAPPPTAPAASDPSLGWGPMPRNSIETMSRGRTSADSTPPLPMATASDLGWGPMPR